MPDFNKKLILTLLLALILPATLSAQADPPTQQVEVSTNQPAWIAAIQEACGVSPDPSIPLDQNQVQAIVAMCNASKEARDTTASEISSAQGSQYQNCVSRYASRGFRPGQTRQPIEVVDPALIGLVNQIGAAIDVNTGKSADLLSKICSYTANISRIQNAIETKTFVEDPYASRQRTDAIELYKSQLFNFVKTGYQNTASSGEEVSPLYTQNRAEHYKDVARQAANNFINDELPQSGNIFRNNLATGLKIEESKNLSSRINSTITKAEYETFLKNPRSLSEEEWWDTFEAIFKPENNPLGSRFLVEQEVANRKAAAIELARQDLSEGQGFLSTKICAEATSDGRGCRYWLTITPSSIVKETVGAAGNARLDQLIQADELGDIVPGGEPIVGEVRNFNPAGNQGFGTPVDGNNNGSFADPDDDINGNGIPNKDDPTFPTNRGGILASIDHLKPLPTLAQLASGAPNVARINWTSTSTTACTPLNSWISKGTNPVNSSIPTLKVIAKEGDTLPASGSQQIDLPLNFDVYVIRQRSGSDTIIRDWISTSSPTLLGVRLAITPDSDDIRSGDKFRIAVSSDNSSSDGYRKTQLSDADLYIEPGTATPQGFIASFKQFFDAIATDPEAKKYRFSYTNSQLIIESRPEYAISCYDSLGRGKEVAITIAR